MKLQLARRTDLALRALHLLADNDVSTRAKVMAPELGTTPHYLPQVLRPLVQAGWVSSDPGPSGGYRLTANLDDCSLLDLIEILEGPTDDQVCVLKGGQCNDGDTCAMHTSWLDVRSSLVHQLSRISITSTRKE